MTSTIAETPHRRSVGRSAPQPARRRYLADPLGFAAGDTNVTRYVGNGPSNATDPTGLVDKNQIMSLLDEFGSEGHMTRMPKTVQEAKEIYTGVVSSTYKRAYEKASQNVNVDVHVYDPTYITKGRVWNNAITEATTRDVLPLTPPDVDVVFVSANSDENLLPENYKAVFGRKGATIIPVNGVEDMKGALEKYISANPAKKGKLKIALGDHGTPGNQYLCCGDVRPLGATDALAGSNSRFAKGLDAFREALKAGGVGHAYLLGCDVASPSFNEERTYAGPESLTQLVEKTGIPFSAFTTTVYPTEQGGLQAKVHGSYGDRPALITVRPK